VVGAAAAVVIALAVTTVVVARSMLDTNAKSRDARKVEEFSKLPTPAVVFTPPAPIAAPIPKNNGATASARAGDSAVPAAASPSGAPVSRELQQPIKQLKAAIESGLPSKITEVYRGYEQDDPTKRFFKAIIDKADSIHVKSIVFRNANVTGNTAELNYRMIINFTANQSKIPTEVPSTWSAVLVRDRPGSAWKIQHLMQHKLS
jgi:hypothetical protein